MKRVSILLAAGFLALLVSAPQASAFGWKDVVKMHQAGVADSLILQKIDYSGTTFHLNGDEITALTEAGVSDAVISAMLRTEAEDEEADGYAVRDRYVRGDYYYDPYDYYPHSRLYVGFGYGAYGPYPAYYGPYYGPYRYPRYGSHYRSVPYRSYRTYRSYRPHGRNYGTERYRARVETRSYTGSRVRSDAGRTTRQRTYVTPRSGASGRSVSGRTTTRRR